MDQFILDIGDPVRILDLAKQMVQTQWKNTGEDISIEYMDLLLGEKEHENFVFSKRTSVEYKSSED